MVGRKYKALVFGELEEITDEFKRRLLENRYPIELVVVHEFEAFQKVIQDPALDIVIVEIASEGLNALEAVIKKPPMRPVIIIGGAERIDMILKAKRHGLPFTITRAKNKKADQEMLFLEMSMAIERIAEPPSMKYLTLANLKRFSQYYNIEQPFFVLDENHHLIYFNRAGSWLIKALHGLDIKVGDDVGKFFFESSKEAFHEHIKQAFGGASLRFEYTDPSSEQDLRQRELVYRPVFTEKQDVIAVSVTSVDISARLRAEQRFRDREAALWSIFDVGPLPLIVLNEDMIVERANPAFRKLLHLAEGSTLEGESADTFIFPEHRLALRKTFRQLLAEQFPYFQNEQHYCKADGMGVWVYQVGFAINLGKDGYRSVLIMAMDITRRKEAEQRNHNSARINAIGELASSVAHDFNNILTIMGTLNSMLEEDLDDLGETQLLDNTEKMSQTISKGTALTKQLLNFEPGEQVELENIDLNAYLRDSHELLQSALGEEIEFKSELVSDGLPIQAGKGQIDQVVMNFVVNARDAMPEGGKFRIRTSRLRIHTEQEAPRGGLTPGDWAVCRFVDTGVGMDNETKRFLFEPFFTTKSSEKGTGLGMATVYRILETMHGKVYVDSAPGEGTTFTLYIPVESGSR